MNSLVEIAEKYRDIKKLNAAIQWFQNSTGLQKQKAFAARYRNNLSIEKPIKFTNAFRYFANLTWQIEAFAWLQLSSQPKTLNEFFRLASEAFEESQEIRLDVPYFSQRDNYVEWWRTCNSSACAMALKFLLPQTINNDDDYLKVVRQLGDTTDHGIQTAALLRFGLKSRWQINLDFVDLDRSLEAGLPIVIGILHKGSWEDPCGGHLLTVIGKTPEGYLCHDPWGNLMTNYADPNGGNVLYPRWALSYRWLEQLPKNGWGRTFYGNQ